MTNENALAIIQETVALPISVEAAIGQWNDYQALTRGLLDDSDYQAIGQKRFKKKSAWRKFARAFNITDHVTFEEIHRAEDGFPLWARIRVTASATNGRTAEADHECHISERCCPSARDEDCDKRTWRNHTCCEFGCTGRAHWSHPGDIPATALTRAKNRAIADLIGAGEVSAEEMVGQRRDGVVEGEVLSRSEAEPVRATPPPQAAAPAQSRGRPPARPSAPTQGPTAADVAAAGTTAMAQPDTRPEDLPFDNSPPGAPANGKTAPVDQLGEFKDMTGAFDKAGYFAFLRDQTVGGDALGKVLGITVAPTSALVSVWLYADKTRTLKALTAAAIAAQREIEAAKAPA